MKQDYTKKSVRAAAILTGSYVAGTDIDIVNDQNQLVINIDFTVGSLTSAEVKVEFSHDGITWYQETFGSISAGTDTLSLGEHAISATGLYRLPVQIKDNHIRVSVKGTGTVTGSSMTVDAIIGVA